MDTRDIVLIVLGLNAAAGWFAYWRMWQRDERLEGRVARLERLEEDRRAADEQVARIALLAAKIRRGARRKA